MYDHADLKPPTAAPSSKRPQSPRTAALRLLALRPRTVSELTGRLAKSFGYPEAEQAVLLLQAEGLINDAEFARQWRDSRERHRPRSREMIERELQQRGVAADVIENAMEDFDSDAAAYRAASKYASRQGRCDRTHFDRRVRAFLDRRGFRPEIIRRTLRQLRQELSISDGDG